MESSKITKSISSLTIQQQIQGLPNFVRPPDEKYECAKCNTTLRPPVKQTLCGHRLCSVCVDQLFADAEEVPCPGDEDCEILTTQQTHPDIAATKELLRMMVYCSFKSNGCDVTVKWSELQQHEESCNFAMLLCSNPGCDKQLLRSNLNQHKLQDCDFFPILCPNCDQSIPKKIYESEHKRTCKPKPTSCAYKEFGCEFVGTPEELKQHLKDNVYQHAKPLSTTIKTMKVEMADMQNKLVRFEAMEGKLHNLEQATAAVAAASATGSDTNEVRIDGNSARPGRGSVAMSGHMTEEITRLKTSVSSMEIQQADSELRFRLIETAGYNGHMIWKITNYRRRKNDAVEARTLSLYSQPFYTSVYGYKMCARVYLNGDGMGKGSHLSLFFVLMRGEYDALLPWPFRQRVTIALLDQSGNQKHIKDAFRPDPTSTSFRLPLGDMNIASGSPLFATQEKVESEAYLKDDTIFISVHVDTKDLHEPLAM